MSKASDAARDRPVTPGVRRPGAGLDERAIDEVLDESFPASDPPSWTPGVSRAARFARPERREISPTPSKDG